MAPLVLVSTPALAAPVNGTPSTLAEEAAVGTATEAASSSATQAAPATTSFSDVRPGTPYFEGVTWLAQNGITTGYKDGTFGVHDDVSRARASAFLYRLMDQPPTPPTSRFPDVPADSDWIAPIFWMVQEGIVHGYADGTFQPDRFITRGEMAKILFGVAGPDGYTPDSGSPF